MAEACMWKTTISVEHDAQLLPNKQQQIWGDIYPLTFFKQYRYDSLAPPCPTKIQRV